jgi:hypothetical protein
VRAPESIFNGSLAAMSGVGELFHRGLDRGLRRERLPQVQLTTAEFTEVLDIIGHPDSDRLMAEWLRGSHFLSICGVPIIRVGDEVE